VGLALIAAIALAFALEYLDDSVRTRKEAERVGQVLGEIPAK
jgi:capsular polysaccharide biosynthesis protein